MTRLLALVPILWCVAGCRSDADCDDGRVDEECPADPMDHTVFVAREGSLAAFRLAGSCRPFEHESLLRSWHSTQ